MLENWHESIDLTQKNSTVLSLSVKCTCFAFTASAAFELLWTKIHYILCFKAGDDPTQINNNLKFSFRGGEKKGGTLSFLFYDFFMTAKPTENVIDFPLSISVLCHKVYPDVFVVYVYGPQRLCINLYPCTKQLSVLCPRSICSMLNFL